MLFGQGQASHIVAFAPLHRDRSQGAPDLVALMKQGITLHPHVPMPALSATKLLEFNGAEFGIAKEGDTHLLGVRQERRDALELADLEFRIGTAIVQKVPSEEHHWRISGCLGKAQPAFRGA